jgi:hypothetical protein
MSRKTDGLDLRVAAVARERLRLPRPRLGLHVLERQLDSLSPFVRSDEPRDGSSAVVRVDHHQREQGERSGSRSLTERRVHGHVPNTNPFQQFLLMVGHDHEHERRRLNLHSVALVPSLDPDYLGVLVVVYCHRLPNVLVSSPVEVGKLHLGVCHRFITRLSTMQSSHPRLCDHIFVFREQSVDNKMNHAS